jgi:hypothetical protein
LVTDYFMISGASEDKHVRLGADHPITLYQNWATW